METRLRRVKQSGRQALRAVQSNWAGAPCPTCAQPLRYGAEVAAGGDTIHVLLCCPQQHWWQEELCARTLHSSVFVVRRRDLEGLDSSEPGPSAAAARRAAELSSGGEDR